MANYEEYVTNKLTGEQVLIKSNDYLVFQSKVAKRKAIWDKQNNKLIRSSDASDRTEQARQEIEAYKNILNSTLDVDDKIDWAKLLDNSKFNKFKSKTSPEKCDFYRNVPKASFKELLPFVKRRRLKAESEAQNKYENALSEFESNERERKEVYEKEKQKFIKQQEEHNSKIEKLKEEYESGGKSGVVSYINLVLERSTYPDSLNIFSEALFDKNSKTMVVNLDLPTMELVPSVIEYKYVASKNEVTEKKMSKMEFESFYNNTLYQIALRTIHEIFESDYCSQIDLVVLNGWVDGVDLKTGKDFRNCIISIQTNKEDFVDINLSRIEPKECFKHLKGVSAGNLINLYPVKPIMVLDTNDNRIIKAVPVLDAMEEHTNLATMDWQEFEVLVRDLISKEFSKDGCKVEVTRASRDAGVDAIAFDEDPIRGGKYVIQAKRYNNIVPVSAVRDLYGTVHNEGAVKGILITTSYYGADSITFANNKPITLINGEELIYMFNKHGYNFKIELAKKQKAASSVSY